MTNQFPYLLLNKHEICRQMNNLAADGLPFLFIIDYKAEHGYVIRQDEFNSEYIRFSTSGKACDVPCGTVIKWDIKPCTLESYESKFKYVVDQIHKGNSFLTNLTQPTELDTNQTLLDLYQLGSAKYKLWLNGKFTVLSPETFIRIQDGFISSFPMKGTIDASIPDAEQIILNDVKERAEHATIVDLIRNDLSMVADEVEVKRYRYIEKLTTNQKDLLQVSSEIRGRLPENYTGHLGDIIFKLLPAGSICGAPKAKTLEIIEQAEDYDRAFYTGICGFFDGRNLDSAVIDRFVEQLDDKLIFKSGGGITAKSDLEKEYEELIQKVYVPIS